MHADLTTDGWIALVGRFVHEPEIAALLKRHKVDLDRIQWIHGSARKGLTDVGVYLCFWKTGIGKSGVVEITGVQFAKSGMRGGVPYPHPFPYGLEAGDSPDAALRKLPPGNSLPVERNVIHVSYADRRIVLEFAKSQSLTSVWWISDKERSRLPKNTA